MVQATFAYMILAQSFISWSPGARYIVCHRTIRTERLTCAYLDNPPRRRCAEAYVEATLKIAAEINDVAPRCTAMGTIVPARDVEKSQRQLLTQ